MNDNLAAIFEANLKAAIDTKEPQKSPIFKHRFQPYNSAILTLFKRCAILGLKTAFEMGDF